MFPQCYPSEGVAKRPRGGLVTPRSGVAPGAALVAGGLPVESLLERGRETNYVVPELNPDESTDRLTPAAPGGDRRRVTPGLLRGVVLLEALTRVFSVLSQTLGTGRGRCHSPM